MHIFIPETLIDCLIERRGELVERLLLLRETGDEPNEQIWLDHLIRNIDRALEPLLKQEH